MLKKCGLCVLALMMISALDLSADENKKDVVRKLNVKGVAPNRRGRPNKPTVLKTADEMSKAIKSKDVVARLQKEVDFEKQNVLLFSWAGSGQDKLSFIVAKENVVVFQFQRGRTRDLRPHVHAFAINKDTKWEFKQKGFGR